MFKKKEKKKTFYLRKKEIDCKFVLIKEDNTVSSQNTQIKIGHLMIDSPLASCQQVASKRACFLNDPINHTRHLLWHQLLNALHLSLDPTVIQSIEVFE